MATTDGGNWYVTTIQRLSRETGRDEFQVAWHDTWDTSTGPYLRPELVYENEGDARVVHASLVEAFKAGKNPSDVEAVVALVVRP